MIKLYFFIKDETEEKCLNIDTEKFGLHFRNTSFSGL